MGLQKSYLEISGRQLPVKIYTEHRYNVRASIGRKAAILRMPSGISEQEYQKHLRWFIDWLEKQFAKDPGLTERFFGKTYLDGDTIEVGVRSYLLKISHSDRKTHSAKIKNKVIHLLLSKQDSGAHLQKSIRHLLSRVVAQDYLPAITRRVHELNNIFYRQPIKGVFLKFNQSNWGSCSAQGNINLSTRLLFAPTIVIDYVIIHELAHLIELNHSDRFWKLVADAMPQYQDQEDWLKNYGEKCNF